jgi:hypothetical protein
MIAAIVLIVSCRAQRNDVAIEPVRIHRFDIAVHDLLETKEKSRMEALLGEYPDMLGVLGKAVLNIQSTEDDLFFDRLMKYYSEPTLMELYRDAESLYKSVEDIEAELAVGFAALKEYFPEMAIPKVYMHVSGFGQNVLAAENLLSVSIDRYMGRDYPLYRRFFNSMQIERMQRNAVTVDYLTGWLMSEFPFTGRENVLLDRMIYEGKIRYVVSLLLPEAEEGRLLGYSPESVEWCARNEALVWTAIIERRHLYTPDAAATNLYFSPSPSLFISDNSPGNLGVWMGLQIVKGFAKETAATPAMIMNNTDAQDILSKSKYKPL